VLPFVKGELAQVSIDPNGEVQTIALFGATGQTGRHLLQLALEAGFRVRALVRSPEKLALEHQHLTVVPGDVRDPGAVATTIQSADAVISVLGPTRNRPVFAVSQGTQHILDAMDSHGVRRLVLSIGAGVRDPHDQPPLLDRLIVLILKLFSRWVYQDMKRTAEHVRRSRVDWTIVRVPMLTDDPPAGRVRAGYLGDDLGFRISRQDMARFMLDQIADDNYHHQAPVISN
jgi:putative NADH-flavin reductase